MAPTLPGLINSINTKVYVGTAGEHLFNIAYLLGVSGLTTFATSRVKLKPLESKFKFGAVHAGVDCLLHILEAFSCARNDARTRDSGQGGNILRRREEQRRRREEGSRSCGRGKSHIDAPDILTLCIEYTDSTNTFCDYSIPLNSLIEFRIRQGSDEKRMRVGKHGPLFDHPLRGRQPPRPDWFARE